MNRVLVFCGEGSPPGQTSIMLREAGFEATVAPSVEALRSALAGSYEAVIAPLESYRRVPELAEAGAHRIAFAERQACEQACTQIGVAFDDVIFEVSPHELRVALLRPRPQRTRSLPAPNAVGTEIVGTEGGLAKAWSVAVKAAGFDADILLTGESGTGKELFAQAIHQRSPRANAAWVPVNCAAIPEGLAESLLFGHEEGAFTGAQSRSIGVFPKAHRGTLFLDEVGDLSLDVQVKLLRALQTREVTPLGGSAPEPADVRVIAATSRDLQAMVAAGSFREDLYYRLAVVPIALPPLRERPGDIGALIDHFLARFGAHHGLAIELEAAARSRLLAMPWPGNVRQLQNTIERLVVLAEDARISEALVVEETPSQTAGSQTASPIGQTMAITAGRSLKEALRDVEAGFIRQALEACDGKRGQCAKQLAISQRALLYKLKEYNIS